MALVVRIKARAVREIHQAARWWAVHRPSAPGAIESDVAAALAALVEQPGIGSKVDNARDAETRPVYLARVGYFLYYRPKGQFLEVVARYCPTAFVSGARAWRLTRCASATLRAAIAACEANCNSVIGGPDRRQPPGCAALRLPPPGRSARRPGGH